MGIFRDDPRGGDTLNEEVIGMLVGIFLENPKKYEDFDFKAVKNTQIAIFRAVLGAVLGKMASIFQKLFQKSLKNTKIRILYPKKYDEHICHFTMEVPPPPPGGQPPDHVLRTNALK